MNNNNSYLNVIKNLVNLNEVNENSYHQGFPVYVTSRIYPDCILKFINNETAKLIKRSKAEEYSEFSSGIFGKIGEIQNDYAKIDAYFKGSNYWIPVQEIKIKKEIRRNIAFYKESGLPWTTEEYINCILYSGEKILESSYTRDSYQNTIDTLKNKSIEDIGDPELKYIFDYGKGMQTTFMHTWTDQNIVPRDNITKLIYEEVFCDCKNIIWVD